MAEVKTARLLERSALSEHTALLRFAADGAFIFTGGQYVIVNTLVPVGPPSEGKTVKRAYSVLSSDADHGTFEIAVRRIDQGPGSNYMLALELGARLEFSGPWGKYLPTTAIEGEDDATLFLATDTGITVALGLLRGAAFRTRLQRARLVWIAESDDYFVSEEFVRERLPQDCISFERILVPMDKEARATWLARKQQSLLDMALRDKPRAAYLSGDGSLLAAFRDALRGLETDAPTIFVESFFHHQDLKTVATRVSQ